MNKATLEKASELNRNIEGLNDLIKSKYIEIAYHDKSARFLAMAFKPSDEIINKMKEVLKAYKAELEEELKNL